MKRDQFLARMKTILDRDGSSDTPLLAATLEANCNGAYVAVGTGAIGVLNWIESSESDLAKLEAVEEEIVTMLTLNPNVVPAIKLYHQRMGGGLLEAKNAVVALRKRRGLEPRSLLQPRRMCQERVPVGGPEMFCTLTALPDSQFCEAHRRAERPGGG